MGKDPAFLFYHHDFLIGTAFMSLEERGAYITILSHMAAQEGYLSDKEIKVVCVGFDYSNLLESKFKFDETIGKYFNKRLLEEIEKRKKFTQSRLNNLHKASHMDAHTESRMVNRDRDVNEIESGTTKKNVYAVFEESVLVLWNEFCDKYPVLSKVKEITGKRRDKLKKRFEVVSFKDFSKILDCISQQQFLLGKNERNWRVSFDWLIENDTNYIKILEKKYANQETEADAARLKEKYKL
ncbi:DUF1376 domain-containing protein [Candidatus Saccharibacteria bacterium]|nr:MAG: DUF1376 domain-containing protein [Candidatus Saccharibacteria bacterium]